MANQSFSDLALVEVVHLVQPLKSLTTADQLISLFRKLGYDLPFKSSDVAGFSNLVSTIDPLTQKAMALVNAATDNDRSAAALAMITEVGRMLQAIADVQSVVSTGFSQVRNVNFSEVPRRLLDYLIFTDLYRMHPRLFGAFYLAGVLDEVQLPADATKLQPKTTLKVVQWSRLPRYLTDPKGVIEEVYDWQDDFKSDVFLSRMELFLRAMAIPGGLYTQSDTVRTALGNTTPNLSELRIPVLSSGSYPSAYSMLGLNLSPAEKSGTKKKGLALVPYFVGGAQVKFPVGESWEGTFTTSLTLDAVAGLVIRPPLQLEAFQNVFSGGAPQPFNSGSLELGMMLGQVADETGKKPQLYIFGTEEKSHLYLQDLTANFFARISGSRKDFGVEVEAKTIHLLLTAEEGDAFLQMLLPPDGIEATFGVGAGLSLLGGFYFTGSSGIEILLPVHIQLGPVEISNILIGIKPESGKIPVEVAATIKAELGPLTVLVENIGIITTLTFPEDRKGNLGPVNAELGFRPPNGVALGIDAGIIKGAGYLYLDFEKGEYAGALQLSVENFLTLTAIGLVTTKNPDGSPGFSLLIIITAEFTPAFQLGYGFTLNGVGGLLGLNRMVLLDPLRDGVRTGAINGIMFPTDIASNAPKIISDLKAIFPPKEGSFLVGPMAKIGWGTPTLITLSLGVIIQLPDPKIAILGVLKMTLPDEKLALLNLQVNFLGTIDPAENLITFDASLYDSHLLHTMTLTGDMALRLKWGDKPDFILSAGGFHPEFEPTMAVPSLQRIGIRILDMDNARIRVETYFALTSNTVQFGARAECYFGIDNFSVSGDLGFDALLQFSPFQFQANCSGQFTLDSPVGDASLRIRALIKGPSPWRVEAEGAIKIFGIEFEAEKTIEWGDDKREQLPKIAIKPLFEAEMKKSEVWHTELPAGKTQLVSIVNPEEDAAATDPPLRIHPFGSLVISQKMVPLDFQMDKFGNQEISDVKKISVQTVAIGTNTASLSEVRDYYAVAQYKKISDAERISNPSFELYKCGVKAAFSNGSADFVMGNSVRRNLEYEQTYIDREPVKQVIRRTVGSQAFSDLLKGSFSKSSPLSKLSKDRLGTKTIIAKKPAVSYTIAGAATQEALSAEMDFASVAEGTDALNALVSKNPALKGKIILMEQI
jgi:hypothetical protein